MASNLKAREVFNEWELGRPFIIFVALAVPVLISETRTKISRVSGFSSTTISWGSDVAFTGYQFRIVGNALDPVTQGVPVAVNLSPPSGGPALTTFTFALTDAIVEAVSPAEGPKIVKLFIQNAGGWSV